MRVLVTGGARYIGSHTCKALHLAGMVPITFDNLSLGHGQVSLSPGADINTRVSTWIDFNVTSTDARFTNASATGTVAYLKPSGSTPGDGNSGNTAPPYSGGTGTAGGATSLQLVLALQEADIPLFSSSDSQKTILVSLPASPSSVVTVHVKSDSTISVTPTTLSFSASQWNVAQELSVTTVKSDWETTSSTALVTLSTSSSDPNYAYVADASVEVPLAVKFARGCAQAMSPWGAALAVATLLRHRRRRRATASIGLST